MTPSANAPASGRHSPVQTEEGGAAGTPAIVPAWRMAQARRGSGWRERTVLIAVLGSVLDDGGERADVGPHRELRVLLQAVVLLFRLAALHGQYERQQPGRHLTGPPHSSAPRAAGSCPYPALLAAAGRLSSFLSAPPSRRRRTVLPGHALPPPAMLSLCSSLIWCSTPTAVCL